MSAKRLHCVPTPQPHRIIRGGCPVVARTSVRLREISCGPIRELQRKGFLRPAGWTSLNWSRNGDVVGSVGVRAEFDRVVLRYRHQRYGEDWKDEEYPIFLDRTPCNYGGERVWFLCPARGCSRRVAVVYGGSVFSFRDC